MLNVYFPNYYDVKQIIKDSSITGGSLNKIADGVGVSKIVTFQLRRKGTQHQAGSDSLLTSELFFKVKQDYFSNTIDHKFHNSLFRLENSETTIPFIESPDLTNQIQYEYDPMPSNGYEDYQAAKAQPNQLTAAMYYNQSVPSYYQQQSSYPMNPFYAQSSGFSQQIPVSVAQQMYSGYQDERNDNYPEFK